MIELDQLQPCQMHMFLGPDAFSHCPFQLYFTINSNETVRRRMPIHEGCIIQHYLKLESEQNQQPLEQIYSFEGGEIIYCLFLTKIENITEEEEMFMEKSTLRQFSRNNSVLRYSMRSSRGSSLFKQKSTAIQSIRQSRK